MSFAKVFALKLTLWTDAKRALECADALIAAELKTRPKCDHLNTETATLPEPHLAVKGPTGFYNVTWCKDCGYSAEVKP